MTTRRGPISASVPRAAIVALASVAVACLTFAGCREKSLSAPVAVGQLDAGPGGQDPDRAPGGKDAAPAACPKLEQPLQAGEACSCDAQCATGSCQDGICCGGGSCDNRPLGAPCSKGSQCDSGFCADGVCCNVACTGACLSCNEPEREGDCVPVAVGAPDPHGICRKDAPETCGQSGFCNGQGGCAKYGTGVPCGAQTCTDAQTVSGVAECDGEGTCVKGNSLDCAPFGCEAGACRSTCSSDAQCVAPATCTAGSCGARGNGQACTENSQCKSNFCVDGVCCNDACTGKCMFCASPGARGTCSPVRAGTMDPRAAAGLKDPALVCVDGGPGACGDNGRCDGMGGCEKYRDGTVCRAGRCDATANVEVGPGTCQGGNCRVPAQRGCAPYRGCSGARCTGQCGSDAQCAPPNICSDGSCGKRPVGAICTRDADCAAPGICAQGRCCASACNATCMACNLAGNEGTCSAVPAGGADPTGSCRDDACSNGCNGQGGCRREPPGTACRAATCAGAVLTRHTCNAAGACISGNESCPLGQVCMGNRCASITKQPPGGLCLGDADCATGACVGGRCCMSACAGACKQCTLGTGWKCENRVDGTGCGGGRTCMGGVCAKKGAGVACMDGGECQSGSCVGGHCCATTCAGPPCRACTAATNWQCRNVPDETACGMSGRVCRAGVCVAQCPVGNILCDGACVNPRSDPKHCGGCRTSCPSGTCMNGSCGSGPDNCPGQQLRCGGQCINPNRNDQHCGGCNRPCRAPTPDCRQGKCEAARGPLPLPL